MIGTLLCIVGVDQECVYVIVKTLFECLTVVQRDGMSLVRRGGDIIVFMA
jgi:hypothetical protein